MYKVNILQKQNYMVVIKTRNEIQANMRFALKYTKFNYILKSNVQNCTSTFAQKNFAPRDVFSRVVFLFD